MIWQGTSPCGIISTTFANQNSSKPWSEWPIKTTEDQFVTYPCVIQWFRPNLSWVNLAPVYTICQILIQSRFNSDSVLSRVADWGWEGGGKEASPRNIVTRRVSHENLAVISEGVLTTKGSSACLLSSVSVLQYVNSRFYIWDLDVWLHFLEFSIWKTSDDWIHSIYFF